MHAYNIKTQKEIESMQKGGKILEEVLEKTIAHVVPGISLSRLDRIAEKEIVKRSAFPSFKRVPGYKWTICACVNEVVVHGIPDDYLIKEGDVVGIDCGVYYEGLHTDAAWTVQVAHKSSKIDTFLAVGKDALYKGIQQVKPGNYIYDISKVIEDTVEGSGFQVVHTLVGHGVGKELHEEPEVPNFVTKERTQTPQLSSGLTIAIEVIYTMGNREVVYEGTDGWTIVTKDGKISALFEATVAVSPHGCIVLTKSNWRKKIRS